MPEFEFEEGHEPAIRRAASGGKINGWSCPFCGSSDLLVSNGDIALDTERVEIYCDNNSACAVRTFVVLVTKGDPKPNVRADVLALHRVDQGTEAEQQAEGFEIVRDKNGESLGRASSFRDGTGLFADQQEGRRRVVERRRREAKITVTPVVHEDDEHEPYGD